LYINGEFEDDAATGAVLFQTPASQTAIWHRATSHSSVDTADRMDECAAWRNLSLTETEKDALALGLYNRGHGWFYPGGYSSSSCCSSSSSQSFSSSSSCSCSSSESVSSSSSTGPPDHYDGILEGYWKFDNPTNTVDKTGNGHTLGPGAHYSYVSGGIDNEALEFSNSNGDLPIAGVTFPHSDLLPLFSVAISVWVKPTVYDWGYVFTTDGGAGATPFSISLSVDSRPPTFNVTYFKIVQTNGVTRSTNSGGSPYVLAYNAWTHLVAVAIPGFVTPANGVMYLYANGVLVQSSSWGHAVSHIYTCLLRRLRRNHLEVYGILILPQGSSLMKWRIGRI